MFPARRAPVEFTRPVYTLPEWVDTFAFYGAQATPTDGPLDSRGLFVVNTLDDRVVTALERGVRVVLVHPQDQVLPTYDKVRWRSGYWSGVTAFKSVGHLLYSHPLNASVTTENWFNHQWWYLFEDSRGFFLDQLPTQPDTLIRTNDGPPIVSNKALLFETRVGDGYLLASGMNHVNATDRPEVQWLMDRTLRAIPQLTPKCRQSGCGNVPMKSPSPKLLRIKNDLPREVRVAWFKR